MARPESGWAPGTVVTKADGMPHRLLRTEFVRGLQDEDRRARLAWTVGRTPEFKRMSGMT
jgi:hypothetical protein